MIWAKNHCKSQADDKFDEKWNEEVENLNKNFNWDTEGFCINFQCKFLAFQTDD